VKISFLRRIKMRNEIVHFVMITVLLFLYFPSSGSAYNSSDIEQFLEYNRTLDGNPYRLSDDKNIDHAFMTELIQQEIEQFNNVIDDYDDPDNPSEGYTWDLKIFHPGVIAGVLPSDGGPYPIIVICKGATGASPQLYWYMDWLASAYAQKGYVVAIPQFIGDTSGPPLGFETFSDIRVDIYALQVSQTLDYLQEKFLASGLLNANETTVIGHSFGGYVSLRATCHDRRITRIALLSAYYEDYYELNVIDTYDIMRIINNLSEEEKPALHVQRYTLNSIGCPDIDPECDPVPVIDGFLMNLSEDPWIPFTGYCDGTVYDCSRGGSFYHYTLYDGPKEDGIRNNPYLDHSGGNLELGRPEVIRLLDNFFETFPVDSPGEFSGYSLVETRSTPGFDPPVFYLEADLPVCPATYLLGDRKSEIDTLKDFRDQVLANSDAGKKLIKLYYTNGERIVNLFDNHSRVKVAAEKLLNLIIPFVNWRLDTKR
jgi:pimeloyl-ACP methyl ester carboxylesterase